MYKYHIVLLDNLSELDNNGTITGKSAGETTSRHLAEQEAIHKNQTTHNEQLYIVVAREVDD